jgi:hypothetical protein
MIRKRQILAIDFCRRIKAREASMQNKIAVILIAGFIIFNTSFSLSADAIKQNVKGPEYYLKRGNLGEQITLEEFKTLVKEIEDQVVDLDKALSETTVWGTNLPYEIGKGWEMELELTKKNIEAAFKYLAALRNNANSMTSSSGLYAALANIDRSLLYLDKIPHFEKNLGKRHVPLYLWRLAFERCHLLPLALAKDMKRNLYDEKK